MQNPLLPWMLLAGLAPAGCLDVSGGAVEARWDLRDQNGARIDCSSTVVAALRFTLTPFNNQSGDPCATRPGCRFACDQLGGATQFDIPEGDYAMSLQPLDSVDRPLGAKEGVVAPAPVVRQVLTGQVTDLSVNLIIVERSGSGAP